MDFNKIPPLEINRIALFDMDETLTNFRGPLKERLLKMQGPQEEFPADLWNMPDHWYERAQAIKREPGFWRGLPKLQWGWDVLGICTEIGYDIHVLTKGPTTGTLAWHEKADWVHEYLPQAKFHITEDKRTIAGRVFVDDHWPFMELWLRDRPYGIGVINQSPFPFTAFRPNVISIQSGLDVVRQKLQEAFDRV